MGDNERPDLDGVLELRIHGINNTSPASMLDLPADSIERVVGDDLAGSWREKKSAQRGLQRGDRGWRPKELTREAYSWGGLARNTPDVPGGGALSIIGRGIARVGWALLLPFGIANIAYWTRRLQTPEHQEKDQSRGKGAGSARLFALGLTALVVVTACEVAMDLVATQCYRGQKAGCDRLPNAFNFLAGRETPLRLVMSAAAPLGLLLVLFLLSSVTRSYYERATSEAYAGRDTVERPQKALLATPGFWSGEAMTGRLVRLHLSVGVGVVTLAMAWPGTFGSGDQCRTATSVLQGECWDQVYRRDEGLHGVLVTCTLVALLVIVAAAVTSCRRASDAPDVPARSGGTTGGETRDAHEAEPRDLTFLLLLAALADLLFTAGLLAFGKPAIDDRSSLLGVSTAPTLTMAVLAALAIGGVNWRMHRFGIAWAPVLAVLFLATAFSLWWLGAVAVALLALLVSALIRRPAAAKAEAADVAWRGAGPGMLMGLSLLVAMTLSSLVTLVAGDWLNGTNSAADLITPTDQLGAAQGATQRDTRLLVPSPYVLFGVGATVAVLLATALLGLVLGRTALEPAPPSATLSPSGESPRLRRSRAMARRRAARAHRAEKAIGLTVMLGMASVVVVVILGARGWPGAALAENGWEGFTRKVIDLATLGMAALGTALLAGLVGGKATGSTRPLGLLWDLVCFLPRAAHPFGPPCYAERAVPEIVGRCAWWLDTEHPKGKGRTRRGDRIILSAHSLGSVLAVAALFAMPEKLHVERHESMRLLTYGSQLRAYFGRIFPELLGPHVLGTSPVRAARLWAGDPWKGELERPPAQANPTRDSVVTRLGGTEAAPPRWRSLWRRTDFLGFPVQTYATDGNDIDRPAEETDETGYLTEIVTHGMYQRAPAYERAFDELAPPAVATVRETGTPGT